MIMKIYSFKKYPVWDEIEQHRLDYSNWDGQAVYNTYFKICIVENRGIAVRMNTDETDLRYECDLRDEAVWEDSCMEFFIKPFNDLPGYINCEINPVGACLCAYGPDRENRVFVKELTDIFPRIITHMDSNGWDLELFVTFEFFKEIFKRDFSENNGLFKANFYKCGDKTNKIHYDSFSKMTTLPPGFHNPECFADIEVSER